MTASPLKPQASSPTPPTWRHQAWAAALEVIDAARVEREMHDLSDGTPFTDRVAARNRLHAASRRLDELLAAAGDGNEPPAFGDVFRLVAHQPAEEARA